jgi:hypothetical protein
VFVAGGLDPSIAPTHHLYVLDAATGALRGGPLPIG